jgi:hypothetical protein
MGPRLHGVARRTEEIELNRAADAPKFVATTSPAKPGQVKLVGANLLDLCPRCGGCMIEIGAIPRASTFAAAAPWNTS